MAMMLIVGILFFFIGIALIIYSIFTLFRQKRIIAQSEKAYGIVTNLTQKQRQKGYIYCPQVRFQTKSGSIVDFQSDFGSKPASHKIGQQIEVLYNPFNPSQAQIKSFLSLWLVTLVSLLMGVTFTGLGFVLSAIGALVLAS
jgi:hypothetical protein